jgi:outer membrane lipoprotein carrier protein
MSDMRAAIVGYHRDVVGLRTAAVLPVALLASLASPSSPAEDLARRVEERHRRAQDLVARFVQTYRSGLIGREVVERGHLSLKPGGRMRWEYEAPEKKTFVSDGKTLYFYVPADRQVIVKEQDVERSLTARLLSGGEILSQFTVDLEPSNRGYSRLRLRPRQEDAEVAAAVLVVDEQGRIHAVETVDAQGGKSRFEFQDVRENVGVKDTTFQFEIPKGVEVITG